MNHATPIALPPEDVSTERFVLENSDSDHFKSLRDGVQPEIRVDWDDEASIEDEKLSARQRTLSFFRVAQTQLTVLMIGVFSYATASAWNSLMQAVFQASVPPETSSLQGIGILTQFMYVLVITVVFVVIIAVVTSHTKRRERIIERRKAELERKQEALRARVEAAKKASQCHPCPVPASQGVDKFPPDPLTTLSN